MHVKLLRAHRKYRNQAEMKVWTAHQYFPVVRLAAVTDMLPVNKSTQYTQPDSENEQHVLKIVQFMQAMEKFALEDLSLRYNRRIHLISFPAFK